jgi:hypothetical protein
MDQTVKPTPTPWEVGSGDDYYIRADAYPSEFIGKFKSDDNGPYVAYIGNRPADFGEANAAFIVKAVNSHDALVKALQEVLHWYGGDPNDLSEWSDCMLYARAAIASIKEPA